MSEQVPDAAAIPIANFQRLLGFHVVEWGPGRAVVVLDVRDELLNRAGTLHGGVLGTLIDAAGGLSGNFDTTPGPPRPSTTLTLITNFISSVRSGQIRAVGLYRGGGRRIFFANVDIFDNQGQLVATGDGTYQFAALKT